MKINTFLFCELAKRDVGGGFTLMGVIPGDEVTIPGNDPIILPSLVCYMVLGEMAGVREYGMQVEILQGQESIFRMPRTVTKRDDPGISHHAQIFTVSPFNPPGLGPFDFRFTLDAGSAPVSSTYRLGVKRSPVQ